MNLERLLENILFKIGTFEVSVSMFVLSLVVIIASIVLHRIFFIKILPNLLKQQAASKEKLSKLQRSFNFTLFVLLLLALWALTGIDLNLETLGDDGSDLLPGADPPAGNSYITLTATTLLSSFFVWQLAQFVLILFDTISLEHLLVGNRVDLFRKPIPESVKEKEYKRVRRNFRYFIQTFAVLLIITILDIDFKLIGFTINKHVFTIRVSNIISTILIILLSRIIIWLVVRVFLTRIYASQKIDSGSQFAINQLFQYVVYFIALLLVLNVMGMNPTVLAGSAAALLLGVGLGLQQTFNDFFSGILLLFERSVEVGDVVDVEGLVGTVRRIGLRTSQVQTLDNLTVIVPNSKLVTNTVTNWSHTDYLARFSVSVGVAYGSNTELVKELLMNTAKAHEKIMNFPTPFVRFVSFGDSSLDFELFFWSAELVPIENVKSDLRFAIDKAFREHRVEIPFPQRDLWVKNPQDLKTKE
jgi:small-conductance mechanosensitive channel